MAAVWNFISINLDVEILRDFAPFNSARTQLIRVGGFGGGCGWCGGCGWVPIAHPTDKPIARAQLHGGLTN